MSPSFQLDVLARRVNGRVVGDPSRTVRDIRSLEDAGPDDLAFLANRRYRKAAERTRAGCVLVGVGEVVPGCDLLEVSQPYVALVEILALFHPPVARDVGISPLSSFAADAQIGGDVAVGPFAVIEAGARLGDRCVVGAGCVVGSGSVVGEDSELKPRVVLYPGTRIGARCLIHAGVVLGADGFGFVSTREGHRKIPQVGIVVLEDDVEIGANSTVDRAALGETVIGRGTKIDDLVMVAHGVRVGPQGILVAQAGIAGSARLGARVTVAGQSGVAGHLEIGDDTVVAAKSAVFEDLPGGSFVAGIPAVDHRAWKRAAAEARRLPQLRRDLREILRRVEALEAAAQGEPES